MAPHDPVPMLRPLIIILGALSLLLLVAVLLTPRPSTAHRALELLFFACNITILVFAIPFRQQWDREQRLRRGLCLRCCYDLRATPGRCPECGAVPAGKAA